MTMITQPGPVKTAARRMGLVVVGVVCLTVLARQSLFTIDQSEMGNVRRFGTALYPKDQPLGPGIHFKLPFIDSADKIQVTLQTLHVPPFDVLTIDNQKVTIDENFNFTVDRDRVYHLLYEVGGGGNVDIREQVLPVARDRTARVLASQNMVTVNANREAIQAQIEQSVGKAVRDLFGVTAHSLQIAAITPSRSFMESIDAATQAKNAAIQAENELRTKQFQAQQVTATAKGAADAAIERARGAAESTKLAALAERTRLVLIGEGRQVNLEAQIKPFGSVEKYLDFLQAEAALKWNGQQPQIVAGAGSGTNFVVPIPALTRSQPAEAPTAPLPAAQPPVSEP